MKIKDSNSIYQTVYSDKKSMKYLRLNPSFKREFLLIYKIERGNMK